MEGEKGEVNRLRERVAALERRLARLEERQRGGLAGARPPGDPRLQRFRLLENLPLVLLILVLAWLAVERLLHHFSG